MKGVVMLTSLVAAMRFRVREVGRRAIWATKQVKSGDAS
jgi:hypothetical protein